MSRYSDGYPVTPHDTDPSVNPGDVSDALWIGGAGGGSLHVTMASGRELTLVGVAAGVLELAVTKVWDTGTDVTGVQVLKC